MSDMARLREAVSNLGGLEYGSSDEGTRFVNADFVSRLRVLGLIDRLASLDEQVRDLPSTLRRIRQGVEELRSPNWRQDEEGVEWVRLGAVRQIVDGEEVR